jgi:hypothetical protein
MTKMNGSGAPADIYNIICNDCSSAKVAAYDLAVSYDAGRQ